MSDYKKQYTPLSISLFSPKQNWTKILTEAIKPLTDLLRKQQRIGYVFLEFNYTGGQNIRFTVWADETEKEEITAEIDERLRSCLAAAALEEFVYELPVDGLFLPFPANSVQYGLYKVFSDAAKNQAESVISEALLSVFCSTAADEENIITFAFYLYSCLLNSAEANSCFINLKDFFTIAQESSRVSLQDFSGEEKEELYSIFQECRHAVLQPELEWMESWRTLCDVITQKYCGAAGNSGNKIKALAAESINRLLGLTEEMQYLLLHMLMTVTEWKRYKNTIPNP